MSNGLEIPPPTEEQMRAALQAFCGGCERMSIPPRPTDHDLVLDAGIGELVQLRARLAELEATLEKINGIRNSIVGMQGFNFSEHAYPLVAALDAVGFKGVGYLQARENFGTLIEQRDTLRAEVESLRPLLEEARELATASMWDPDGEMGHDRWSDLYTRVTEHA